MKIKKIKNQKGFTLVELMVVLVIIGILATMAIPKFMGASNKAKATEFKPILKQIYTLQTAYYMEKDAYSADLTVLGFDAPASAESRFTYTATTTVTDLGHAVSSKGKAMGLAADDAGIGCIDDNGVIKAKGGLAELANVAAGC